MALCNKMVLVITPTKAQSKLAQNVRERRLQMALTQEGLANRAGVALSTLRKFEQQGTISIESLIKLLMVVGGLKELLDATAPKDAPFSSIDDVLSAKSKPTRKRGQRL